MTKEADRDIRSELYAMHWLQKQSLHEMAHNLNISRRTLVRMMMKLRVPRRSYANAMVLKSKTSWITRLLLYDLYWKQRMSTSQIGAKLSLDHATVLELMNRYSIRRRTTSEAGMKYRKRAFSGDFPEACYLLGFRAGDLHAALYGYQVRLETSSTHPAMSRLFVRLFGKYGRVGKSPATTKGKYEWLNYCYLDRSFEFLLAKPPRIPEEVVGDQKRFLAFLAGYTDAEGSFRIYRQDHNAAYSFRINSQDEAILRQCSQTLRAMGYHVYFELSATPNATNRYRRNVWSLGMFRKAEIVGLLEKLPLLHDEKVSWQKLMIASAGEPWNTLQVKVLELRSSIKAEVVRYSEIAEARKRGFQYKNF